jgi:muconolactone delta-isomerase
VRRPSLVSNLYRAARMANDVSALASGNPHRIARRAKNKIMGRAMARAGMWRALWR